MNKINYFLVSVIIVFLISNIFLYSNLSKQNLGIKKDISDLKQEQINQNENVENLQNLVTFNWKEYRNDKFGFSFKYPEYVNVCDDTLKSQDVIKAELNLNIRTGYNGIPDTCDTRDNPSTHITVKKNTENYKTAEEAFYKELSTDYTSPDSFYNKELQEVYSSLVKNNFTYFKISGLDAYGGRVVFSKSTSSSGITLMENYKVVILKNDHVIKFSTDNYLRVDGKNRQFGNKPVFDIIISSFHLNTY
ncbi:MAG: hypothetical protein Q8N37_02975 [bacterium]|nr:hypothetical protein [bacterium]